MYKPCNLLLFCFSASTSLMGILRFSRRYVALQLKQTTINIDFPVTSPHATETVTTFEPRDWVQRSPWRQGAYLIEVHYKVKVQLILGLVSRNRRVPTFLRKNDGTSYGRGTRSTLKFRGRFRLRWPETETTLTQGAPTSGETWLSQTFLRSFNDDPLGACFVRRRCVFHRCVIHRF